MKSLLQLILFAFFASHIHAQNLNGTAEERESLNKATAVLRDAFAKGDAALVTSLHSPDIVKYFGGNNVVTGRASLRVGILSGKWFRKLRKNDDMRSLSFHNPDYQKNPDAQQKEIDIFEKSGHRQAVIDEPADKDSRQHHGNA